jgi:GT2 family glycosyltransferase
LTERPISNLGWAGGYNRALQIVAAEGYKFAYLLNNDAVAHPGAVEAAVAPMRDGDRIAAVGSLIRMEDGTIRFAGEYWKFLSAAERRALTNPMAVIPVRTIHGAGFALNMQAYREVGPFPEEHFLYWEETVWFGLAKRAGWKLLLNGASEITHIGAASNTSNNTAYYEARNRFLALRRCISVSGQDETWFSVLTWLLYELRFSDPDRRIAEQHGIIDGVLGRFGKRRPPWSPAMTAAMIGILRAVVLPYRVTRKVLR